MPEAPAGVESRPPRTSTSGPLTMLLIGVLLLLAAVGAAITAALGGSGIADKGAVAVPGVSSIADDGTSVLTDLQLTAGERYVVLTDPDTGVVSASGLQVRLGGPDSAELVPVLAPAYERTSVSGRSFATIVTFTAPATGGYTVTVAPNPASDPVRPALSLATYTSPAELAPGIIALSLGIIGAIAFGSIGFGLTLAGSIWLVRRKGNARRAAPPA